MTKLVRSYAILSLEGLGYEQANNKPYSFLRKYGPLSSRCLLSETEGVIMAAFTLSLTVEGETLQAKASVPAQSEWHLREAEFELFGSLIIQLEQQAELARIAYTARNLHIAEASKAVSDGLQAHRRKMPV